ncbi:hypothetical protein F4821DRAFT_122653 [Hypoxylon rubiginosum]|uniref:Uncharacterized protein n=1 Tax=Hypoxylon rubiginosum TaxID=110542 RepID=A0ACC0D2T5_9PEZI|nr:hypothetical protein F4821DRAFT_122653 [Hypoxylon rubiginosum]
MSLVLDFVTSSSLLNKHPLFSPYVSPAGERQARRMAPPLISNSNLEDNRGPSLRTFCITMAVLQSVAVLFRVWARALGEKSHQNTMQRFWWDDWTCIIAWAILTGTLSALAYLVELGLGRYPETIPPDNVIKIYKSVFVAQVVYFLGMAFARSSALFFYQRIFDHVGSRVRYVIWIAQILNIAWCITFSVETFAHCHPIQKFWTPSMKEGHCLDQRIVYLGNSIVSVTIDLLILMIPAPLLWRLKLSTLRKIQVTFVFVLGYGVIVGSIGRLIVLSNITSDEFLAAITYTGVPIYQWFGVESSIALISTSLPSIWSLLKRMRRHAPVPPHLRAESLGNRVQGSSTVLLSSFPNSVSGGGSVNICVAPENESREGSMGQSGHLRQPVAAGQTGRFV